MRLDRTEPRRGRLDLSRALRRSLNPLLLLAALSLPLAPASLSQQSAGPNAVAVREDGAARALELSEPVARELRSGETHAYTIKLGAGQLARVEIEQQGAGLSVVLLNPEGKKADEFDRRGGTPIQEPIMFVAEKSGKHRLLLSAPAGATSPVRYELILEELRAADAKNKGRASAERAFAKGAMLQYARADAESLRAAIRKYEEALSLWRSIADRDGESRALGSTASAYSSLGEYRRAVELYKLRLEIVRAAGDRLTEATILETVGWLYFNSLGAKQEALEHLQQALRLYRETGRREGEARVLTIKGKVYAALGETTEEKRKALDQHTQALDIYRASQNRYYEGDSLGNLMSAWGALRRPRSAIFFGKQAVNAFQEIRANIKGLEKDTQQTFLKSKEDTYRSLAGFLISEGRLAEAQQVLGMLKEEEYFEFVRRDENDGPSTSKRAAATPAEAEWEKRYREVAEEITTRGRERGQLIQKQTRTPDEERRLTKLEQDLALAQQAFQQFLDKLSEELGDSETAKQRIFQLQESQGLMEDLRELGQGSVALYTLVGEDKYRVILITPDVQRAFEYPIKSTDLAQKVAAFRDSLQNHRSNPLPLAQELYKILVGPVAKDLAAANAETLMWSLDGVLRYVPVAALHDGERYMVERYRNAIFTPASQTRLKDAPSAKWHALGFGVSKSHLGFSPLPAVPEELRAVIQEAAAADTGGVLPGKIFLDEAFTEESLRTLLRQRFPLVHIASHFSFQPGDEMNSFLLLGDGRRLSLNQIKTSLSFGGVELLTLSACDTATGGAGSDGKEVEGFAVLAQRRGAKAVVASLWPVADVSTRLLMQEFYRVRDSQPGLSKAEALRQAQLRLMRWERPAAGAGKESRGMSTKATGDAAGPVNFAHPYFWAPFLLIGNWK